LEDLVDSSSEAVVGQKQSADENCGVDMGSKTRLERRQLLR